MPDQDTTVHKVTIDDVDYTLDQLLDVVNGIQDQEHLSPLQLDTLRFFLTSAESADARYKVAATFILCYGQGGKLLMEQGIRKHLFPSDVYALSVNWTALAEEAFANKTPAWERNLGPHSRTMMHLALAFGHGQAIDSLGYALSTLDAGNSAVMGRAVMLCLGALNPLRITQRTTLDSLAVSMLPFLGSTVYSMYQP